MADTQAKAEAWFDEHEDCSSVVPTTPENVASLKALLDEQRENRKHRCEQAIGRATVRAKKAEARIRELEVERDARSCNGHCQDCDEHRWQRESSAAAKVQKAGAHAHELNALLADRERRFRELEAEVQRKDEVLRKAYNHFGAMPFTVHRHPEVPAGLIPWESSEEARTELSAALSPVSSPVSPKTPKMHHPACALRWTAFDDSGCCEGEPSPAPSEPQDVRVCLHCGQSAERLGPIGMWQHCPEHEGGSLTHEWPE